MSIFDRIFRPADTEPDEPIVNEIDPSVLRAHYNALVEDTDIDGDELVPIPCHCEGGPAHGPHYVSLSRLRPGGDLHGRLVLEPIELPS